MSGIDWNVIRAEYIRGGTSYRKLAEKYDISFGTLKDRAVKEKWTDLRERNQEKIVTKIVESAANREAKRVNDIQTVADLLLKKIIEGVQEGVLIIDSQSIRQITASLKDLRDIKGIKSELDMQEQIARVDKLRKEAKEDKQSNDIKVVISADLDQYSK